jgi:ELWxxDGT repeat protein
MVKDIAPSFGSNVADLITSAGTLFFVAEDGQHGAELWKSDGTAAGTVLVKDIWPGVAGSNPASFVSAGNRLIFRANDGSNGEEVWRSEGTDATTILVHDVLNGSSGSYPQNFTVVGTQLFASISDENNGQELWVGLLPWALPLHLVDFKARLVNADGLLSWNTTNEENTSHFIVERSLNGRSFTSIGKVQAANTPGNHS